MDSTDIYGGFDSLTPYQLSACLDYDQDICPNCGDFAQLSEVTGWCIPCTKNLGNVCIRCGDEIPANHQRHYCWDCKQELWLKRYANAIELVMLSGVRFSHALTMVQDAIRPICVVCNKPIKGGTPGESLFCSTIVQCVRARNNYRRLIKNGVPPNRAIDQVIRKHRIPRG